MIRAFAILITTFFLLALSFNETIRELESEIVQELKEKHGYEGWDYFSNHKNISNDMFIEGLKKFKRALEKTKLVRNFKGVRSLSIHNMEEDLPLTDKIVYNTRSYKESDFFFPALGKEESFIELISADPDNEPAYQKYLKDYPELAIARQEDIKLKKAIADIKLEIEQMLEKHDYRQNGFSSSDNSSDVKNSILFTSLKKFKRALEKTKFIRNFKYVGQLYFYNEEILKADYTVRYDDLSFSVLGREEIFIELISEDLDNEPVYQKYLEDNPGERAVANISQKVLALKKAITDLALEINQILEKHGYKYSGFLRKGGSPNVGDHKYFETLKKFKIALEKTRFIRSFKNVLELYVLNGEMPTVRYWLGNESFGFSTLEPPEAFIEFISADPDNEPAYQKYLEGKPDKKSAAKSRQKTIMLKKAIGKLTSEIMQELREKHGYERSRFFERADFPVEDDIFLEGLKKLKIALEKTKFVRSFEDVLSVGIHSKDIAEVESYESRRYAQSLWFSAFEPAEAFIGLISKDLDNEPDYQKYLKEEAQRDTVALKKIFGPWYKYHEAGKEILCKNIMKPEVLGPGFTLNINKIRKEAKRLLGKEVTLTAGGSGLSRYFRLWTKYPPPSSIDIMANLNSGKSYVQVNHTERQFFLLDHNILNKTWFDSRCNLIKGELREYDGERQKSRKWFNSNGNITRTVYVNKEVLSLEEIYADCTHPKLLIKLFEKLKKIDRTLVTIFDMGISYNDRGIAYKINKMSVNKLDKETRKIEKVRLEAEAQKLVNTFESLNPIQRLWSRAEYESELADIYRRYKNIDIGWDYADGDAEPYDYNNKKYFNEKLQKFFRIFDEPFYHGTQVAGVVSKGSDYIEILPIRISFAEAYDAVVLAYGRGSRIINISMGSSIPFLYKIIENLSYAVRAFPNMLFVVAAGNSGNNLDETPVYPAANDSPNILSVASVDGNNNLSDFSNFSKTHVDIAAPGEDILSFKPENTSGHASGTSFAAPQVTRVAAKVKSVDPSFTPTDMIAIILETGTKVESLKDKIKCGCVLNEKEAIKRAGELAIEKIEKSAARKKQKGLAVKRVGRKVKRLLEAL